MELDEAEHFLLMRLASGRLDLGDAEDASTYSGGEEEEENDSSFGSSATSSSANEDANNVRRRLKEWRKRSIVALKGSLQQKKDTASTSNGDSEKAEKELFQLLRKGSFTDLTKKLQVPASHQEKFKELVDKLKNMSKRPNPNEREKDAAFMASDNPLFQQHMPLLDEEEKSEA